MAERPRYLTLAAALRRNIAKGRYAVGDQLPTELALCETHAVSRHTARAALKVLEDQGLIERRPGLGTHVISSGQAPTFTQPLGGLDALLQYAHEARLSILSGRTVSVNGQEGARIGAPRGSKWLRIDGVRRAGRHAVAATSIYIAHEIGARLADFSATDRAVTEVVEAQYGVSVASIVQRISAELLSCEDAATLGEAAQGPSLRTVRRYFDASERLFVASDSRHPADRFSYEMTFQRSPLK